MAKDFLLEIGCEEIPARFMSGLCDQLRALFESELGSFRLSYDQLDIYGSYRRLVVMVNGLSEIQEETTTVLKGPPTTIAFGQDGELTKAGEGFLKKCGVTAKEAETQAFDGKDYLACIKTESAKDTQKILPELVLSLIKTMNLPIAMTWGDGEGPFIRPVHWVLCLYGGDVVPLTLFGIESGHVTYGHRFLSQGESLNGKSIPIKTLSGYMSVLSKEGSVLVSAVERKKIIQDALAKEKQTNIDADLLEEVTYLVEWPVLLQGSFDERFLTIPKAVLIECMKKHQKYFPIFDHNNKLTNLFLLVAQKPERLIKGRTVNLKEYMV